ncbi:hypothetical protein Tco_1462855, partial [Tanacetum coccineum]
MRYHVGSYDGEGDSNNYLHYFEGDIRMQKWAMPIACLHEEHRISGFVRGQRTRNLVEFLSTDLPTTYKDLMEKTYTWIEAREVSTNEALNDHREGSDMFKKNSSRDNNKGKRNREKFSPYHGANHGLLSSLSKSPREILATKKIAKTLEQPPRMLKNRRHQIEEAVKSWQLSHLVKGIKKGKAKTSNTQQDDWKKGSRDTAPVEVPILMISKKDHIPKRKLAEEPINGLGEITFPPVSCVNNSSDTIIIRDQIFGRQVNRVYMDSGSSYEVIYEHCFLKLKPFIRSLIVDSKVLLVGFSGEHSWPIGEVPLEITIGDSPFTRTKTLNFVIVRSNSLHNLLFRRTAMQKMGIIVSMIHDAIKFHTPRKIGIILSIYEPDKVGEGQKKLRETSTEVTKGVLSCTDAEERIIINDKYLEHMVIIGKQLPTNSKEKLRDLLRSNVDVFAWTHVDMTGKSRTIMVGGKPFNTEHKLNKYKHIKSIKQKKRGLGPDRSQAACKEVEELIKAGILRRVKNQTLVANPVMTTIRYKWQNKTKTKQPFSQEKEHFVTKDPFGLEEAELTY